MMSDWRKGFLLGFISGSVVALLIQGALKLAEMAIRT